MEENINPNLAKLGTESAFTILSEGERLRKEGKDIINLGIGQPDFKTPPHIVEAAIKAIKDGHHGYTPAKGIIELRETVCEDIFQRRKAKVHPDNVIIVPGGKVTMWHAILMFGGKGKEIIYPNPGFPIYESAINYSGAKAVPLSLNIKNEFALDVEKLKNLINERTSLIIFNSPSNPTGSIISKKTMDEIVLLLEKFPKIKILSDEIYSRIIFDNQKHTSMLSYPQISDRLIILDGWSKSYAMTGWRIGYSVWPKKFAEIAERLNINSFSCTNAPTQFAAIAALKGPQQCVEDMVSAFDNRRKIIIKELNTLDGIICSGTKGAFYSMPSIANTKISSSKMQNILLYKLGITTVSGNSFGKFGEGYIRISFANSEKNIIKAISRIRNFISKEGWHAEA